MTIRMLKAWNGLPEQMITTLSGAEESRLVGLGLATYDLDGPAENLRMAQLATDASGKTVDALSAGSAAIRLRTGQHLDNRAFHRLGKPLAANIQAGSGVTVSGQSGNTPTVEYVQVDGMRGIKVTTAAGFFCDIHFPEFSDTVAGGRVAYLMQVHDCTTLQSYTAYVGDSGYINFFTSGMSVSSVVGAQYNGFHVFAPETATANPRLNASAVWSVGGGSPSFGVTTFAASKLRITPAAGKSTSVTIFGAWVGYSSEMPRVVVSADDGWASQYQDMLPILEKYSLRGSFAIIADMIDTNGYMTLPQLQDLVARGHECVVHGPIGGGGSLQKYTNYSDILDDVTFHRDYLVNNGLAKNGSEKIYVYPQGKFALSLGDETIFDALRSAGFVGGRIADEKLASKPAGPLFKRQVMVCNVAAHLYDSSNEVGNISNIVARVQSAGTRGLNVILVFHKFTSGTPGDTNTIQNSNFEIICAAINALENAGTAQNALLSELVFESLAM